MSAVRPSTNLTPPSATARLRGLQKHNTVSVPELSPRSSGNHLPPRRRVSVSNDGGELPPTQQCLDSFYNVMHLLGTGVSSKVFLATHKKTGQYVAIKIIPKKILISNLDLAREISILKRMNHRYIVKLYDVFITPDHLQLVMEACEGQELFDEICNRRTFDENDVKDLALKLLDAIGYLHHMNIAHRDLKPENIMFVEEDDGTKNLKIIDFGFAQSASDKVMHTAAGTLGYIAPEVLRNEPFTIQSDMWSFGVIIYILLVGFPPFLSHPDDDDPNTLLYAPFWSLFNEKTDMLIDAIKKGEVNWSPLFWDKLPQAKEFLSAILRPDPKERMTAAQALSHPWITSWVANPEIRESQEAGVGSVEATEAVEAANHSDDTEGIQYSEGVTGDEVTQNDVHNDAQVVENSSPSDNTQGTQDNTNESTSDETPASNNQPKEDSPSSPAPVLPLEKIPTPSFSPSSSLRLSPHRIPPLSVPSSNSSPVLTTASAPDIPSTSNSSPTLASDSSTPVSSRAALMERFRTLQREATIRSKSRPTMEFTETTTATIFTATFAPSGITELDEVVGASPEGGQSDELAKEPEEIPVSPREEVESLQRSLNGIGEDFHEWRKASFKGPAWCVHCEQFIWGVLVKQGYRCKTILSPLSFYCKGDKNDKNEKNDKNDKSDKSDKKKKKTPKKSKVTVTTKKK